MLDFPLISGTLPSHGAIAHETAENPPGGFIRSGSMTDATENVVTMEPGAAASAPEAQERMSILAVVSVIIGVISVFSCWVPGLGLTLGLLAGVMGLIALVRITRSSRALRGKTPAIAGTVLGTMAFLFGVVMIVGITLAVKAGLRYIQPILALEQGNVTEARAVFSKDAAAKLDDDTIRNFQARVDAQLGKFQGGPTDLIDFVKQTYDRVSLQGAALSNVPSTQDVVPYPLPANFEKGEALIIVLLDQREASANLQYGTVTNIGVTRVGVADIVWLFPIENGKKNGATPITPPPAAPLNPESGGKF